MTNSAPMLTRCPDCGGIGRYYHGELLPKGDAIYNPLNRPFVILLKAVCLTCAGTGRLDARLAWDADNHCFFTKEPTR